MALKHLSGGTELLGFLASESGVLRCRAKVNSVSQIPVSRAIESSELDSSRPSFCVGLLRTLDSQSPGIRGMNG